MRISLLL